MQTLTGHKDRAATIAEHIRNRGRITEHHTEHREVIRQELPEDIRKAVMDNALTATQHSLEIMDLKRTVDDLRREVSTLHSMISDIVNRRVA